MPGRPGAVGAGFVALLGLHVMPSYLDYYNLETYLFDKVSPQFRKAGKLAPLDFFLILHWKSARARTKARDRLKALVKKRPSGAVKNSFTQATKEIAKSLYKARAEERLKVLMKEWKFRLPTATAVLSVLYPDDFTIWDVRVRDAINSVRNPKLSPIREEYSDRTWSQIWKGYLDFKRAVIESTPSDLSLRDKDRYLWGKSLAADIERDLHG